jgi:hypothetical protein
MINFQIKEEIYNIPLAIYVGEYSEFSRLLDKIYNIGVQKQIHFGGESQILINKGDAECIIWLPRFEYSNIEDISTLSHEINHVCFYIFEYINIPILDNQSNHAYIYLNEYFLIKALKKLTHME